MRNKLFNPIMFIAFLLLVIATGCSSNSSNDGKGNEGSSEQIHFGILTSITGDFGPWGVAASNAALLAIDEINQVGGPLDRNIKVFVEDDASTVEGAVQAAQKLLNVNSVCAISGPFSDQMMALLDLAENAKVVLNTPAAGTVGLDEAPGNYHFRTIASDSLTGKGVARAIWDSGCKDVAVIIENAEGAVSMTESFMKEYEALGGKILTEVKFNGGQSTYRAELKKLFSVKPKVIYMDGNFESGSVILKEWYTEGYGGQWYVGTGMLGIPLLEMSGVRVSEGTRGVIPPYSNMEKEWYKNFAQSYEEKYGSEPSPDLYQANSYDAAIVIALAIEAAGEATGPAIMENMRKVSNPPGNVVHTYQEGLDELRKGNDINYDGVSGVLDFDEYGNVKTGVTLVEAKNGKLVPVKEYSPEEL